MPSQREIKSGNPYPLTFTEPGGESVTVYVTLKDHGAGPQNPNNNTERIAANDFFYGLDQSAISADMAKALASAAAYKANGDAMDLNQVSVNAAQLAAINTALAAGDKSGNPFDLSFATPDGTSATIQVILKDYGAGTIDPGNPAANTERIGANDFAYGVDQPQITEDMAKELAKAEAVDKDGNPIDAVNITVDAGELQAINDAISNGEKGEYPLPLRRRTEPM